MTPKYLYDATGLRELGVTVPLGFGLSRVKILGSRSLCYLGKFISTVLESSNGELCVYDHSNPPPSLSIMSFSFS